VHWAELCLQWVFTSEVKLDKAQHRNRRWNVIGSGLLCAAFAVVVLYTSPRAFFSPLALVVVAAIGLAAGAGAGAGGSALTGNKDIVLPAESNITFELSQALELRK